MKQRHFIKFDPRINQLTGCQRATLILSCLEYWFTKKPDGFYKFMEPCSHRLYKKGDSWTEELGCERRSFSRSFKKIGVKYGSRMAFEAAPDKFQGKMYASYYDRYTNRTFFIRNHALADQSLKDFSTLKPQPHKKEYITSEPTVFIPNLPLSTGQNGLSYIEAKKTSIKLSSDNLHAGDEIVKKMLDIWTSLVEQGLKKIELTGRRIAFLKKAFVDKFNSNLDHWKKYCQDIASSKFLMGEIKSSFRATLDWALKFDIIQKIFEGNYGIGDRNPSLAPSSCESFAKGEHLRISSESETINTTDDPEAIKDLRLNWLRKVGAHNYQECFKGCAIEFESDTTIVLRPSSRYNAKLIASYSPSSLLDDSPFTAIHIFQEESGLVFDKWFGEGQGKAGISPLKETAATPINPTVALDSSSTTAPTSQPPSGTSNIPEQTMDIQTIDIFPDAKPLTPANPTGEGLEPATGIRSTGRKQFEDQNNKQEQTPNNPPIENTINGSHKQTPLDQEASNPSPHLPETRMLRKILRETIPPNQFPGWLGRIEFSEITQAGVVVVTFEDALTVDWCRSRFSREIFQSARSIWRDVNGLIIRQQSGTIPITPPVVPYEPSQGYSSKQQPERVKISTTWEQAVQTFLSKCSLAGCFPGNRETERVLKQQEGY